MITSTKNEQVKYVKLLQLKSKHRLKDSKFVVEGVKEIKMALTAGYTLEKVFIENNIFNASIDFDNSTEIIPISNIVYEHLAYRSSTEGLLAVFSMPKTKLSDVSFTTQNPLVIVLESPEKPGNIGAILRTADAANVDAVCIANPKTDLYNPNTIRSSLGTIFTNRVVADSSENIYNFLIQKCFGIYAATLQNSNLYLVEDYTAATAFIMGSEAFGLSNFWRESNLIKTVHIPMLGQADSMNLSVSTAILTFEAIRQRRVIH